MSSELKLGRSSGELVIKSGKAASTTEIECILICYIFRISLLSLISPVNISSQVVGHLRPRSQVAVYRFPQLFPHRDNAYPR